jgi:hypothetical protein
MHAAAAAGRAAAAVCMHACVAAACMIDTVYLCISAADLLVGADPGVETAPRARPKRSSKTLRYFYTKIRFSTPGLSAFLGLFPQLYLS